jgi:hypothetical protein
MTVMCLDISGKRENCVNLSLPAELFAPDKWAPCASLPDA